MVVVYAAEVVGGTLEARATRASRCARSSRRSCPWDELAFESTRLALRDSPEALLPAGAAGAARSERAGAARGRARPGRDGARPGGSGRAGDLPPSPAGPRGRAGAAGRGAAAGPRAGARPGAVGPRGRGRSRFRRGVQPAFARALHALGRDAEALAAARRAQSLLLDPQNFRQTAPRYLNAVSVPALSWAGSRRRWRPPRRPASHAGRRAGRVGLGGGAGAGRGRAGALLMDGYRFTYTVQVRFRDLDALGHVNNAAHLTYLEPAHGVLTARERPRGPLLDGYDPGQGRGGLPVARGLRRRVRGRRALRVGQAVVVRAGTGDRGAADRLGWSRRRARSSSTTTTPRAARSR